MKTHSSLSLLAVLVVSLGSARAAYITTKFKLIGPYSESFGSLALTYDNTLPIVTPESGIQHFEMLLGDKTSVFIDGGTLTNGTSLSSLSYRQETGRLSYNFFYNTFGYGLNNGDFVFKGVVYEDVLIGTGTGRATLLGIAARVVPIGVPDGGSTLTLLASAMLGAGWLGWQRRIHG